MKKALLTLPVAVLAACLSLSACGGGSQETALQSKVCHDLTLPAAQRDSNSADNAIIALQRQTTNLPIPSDHSPHLQRWITSEDLAVNAMPAAGGWSSQDLSKALADCKAL